MTKIMFNNKNTCKSLYLDIKRYLNPENFQSFMYLVITSYEVNVNVLNYYSTFEEKLTLYLAHFLCSFLTLPP